MTSRAEIYRDLLTGVYFDETGRLPYDIRELRGRLEAAQDVFRAPKVRDSMEFRYETPRGPTSFNVFSYEGLRTQLDSKQLHPKSLILVDGHERVHVPLPKTEFEFQMFYSKPSVRAAILSTVEFGAWKCPHCGGTARDGTPCTCGAWKCSACKYVNDPLSVDVCDLCGEARPMWTCPICTLERNYGAKCTVCDSDKPAAMMGGKHRRKRSGRSQRSKRSRRSQRSKRSRRSKRSKRSCRR
jgi:hypothetical protein